MQKDDATWLKIAYATFAILVGYTLNKAMGTLGLETGYAQRYTWFQPLGLAVSVVGAILVTWYLKSNQERHEYFLASIGEIRKVTWPNFIDTRRLTIVVCVVVGIFALILFIFDFVWAEILKWLLS